MLRGTFNILPTSLISLRNQQYFHFQYHGGFLPYFIAYILQSIKSDYEKIITTKSFALNLLLSLASVYLSTNITLLHEITWRIKRRGLPVTRFLIHKMLHWKLCQFCPLFLFACFLAVVCCSKRKQSAPGQTKTSFYRWIRNAGHTLGFTSLIGLTSEAMHACNMLAVHICRFPKGILYFRTLTR